MREHPHAFLIEKFLAWLTADSSPNTVRGYSCVLWQAHRDLPEGLPIATTNELQQWIWQTTPDGAPRWAAKTRAMYRSAIIAFFAWCFREELVDWNPAARLPRARQPKKLPRPCSHEQLAEILARAPEPYRTWSLLAAYAGARCCEIARLRLPDDLNEHQIYLHGKGDEERLVPCHPDIWEAVRQLPAGMLAGGRTANRVSGGARAAFGRLGIRTSMHRLRDWYGTWGYAATSDLRAVQHTMGHSNPRTTAGYVGIADPALRAVVSGLPRLTAPATEPTAGPPVATAPAAAADRAG